MKFEVVSDIDNVLLGRREIIITVGHPSKGTPGRIELRRQIAAKLNVDLDQVYVVKLETKTGGTSTEGEVRVYHSSERARLVERDHILDRNTPPEEEPPRNPDQGG